MSIESPKAGAAIAPLALGVAYSRLHTGAHWLSDVIGGLALGTGVALLGGRLVPPRSREETAAGGADRRLPASPDGEGAFIVVNRSSGTSVVRLDPARMLAERLPRAELHLSEGGDPGEAVRAALARADPPRILGVCGGDGSVAAVAHEARLAGLPLLVVPTGTFNHFAKAAGASSPSAAVDALQRGEGVRVDVAELSFNDADPITVLNTASVGVYPAGLMATRVLRDSEPVTIVIGGRQATVWTLFVGVGANDPDVAAPLGRRRLDGGVLDVRVLHADTRARAVASLAFGRRISGILRGLCMLPRRIESFMTPSLEVIVRPSEDQPPGFAHDGEVATATAAEAAAAHGDRGYRTAITIEPGALDVYRPAVAHATR